MWLGSALTHLSSAATPSWPSSLSFLSQTLVPRALLGGSRRLAGPRRSTSSCVFAGRRFFTAAAGAASAALGEGGGMVPEDAASLLRTVYEAKVPPQFCLTTTGSGGQAVSWVLGVPGASACLLEATVPYSIVACDEKMAAGPPAPGYCSREAAEALARDAYRRAVALCVGSSDRGPRALSDKRVVGVGCTAAVVSSHPKRGLHRCFVCAQTPDGLAHYELKLVKGRRDRDGEDAAVSRVLLQAIAEAAGVAVPNGFKSDHLFLDPKNSDDGDGGEVAGENQGAPFKGEGWRRAGGDSTAEKVPTADFLPEPDAFEELVSGRTSAVLVVPRDTLDSFDAGTADISSSSSNGRSILNNDAEPETERLKTVQIKDAVVLRDDAVKAALPRGATVILPGSYNPLHKGHIGLLEAACALHSKTLASEATEGSGGDAGGAAEGGVRGTRTPKNFDVHAIFEVSVANADKGGLAADEVRRRVRQFSEAGGIGWPYPVVVTRAPLFSKKARLFPGCAFVVGADTAKRIIDPKYYGDSKFEMVAALAEIRNLGCSFIVGGRKETGGGFLTLEGVLKGSALPESLRGMFHGLDEASFREDLSSTSIRASTTNAGQ